MNSLRNKYTLIEMIATTAIIAILIAILCCALGSAEKLTENATTENAKRNSDLNYWLNQ